MNRLFVAAAALILATSAKATTISFSDSFGLAATNWNKELTLKKFDISLGTLNSVTFNYGSTVSSIISFESLDAGPSTVSANTNSTLTFSGPISNTLNGAGSSTRTLSAFDGIINFSGTSGVNNGQVFFYDYDTLTVLSDLAGYIGLGTFNINVQARDQSNVSGAGNLISQIQTQARADIQVVYDYSARLNQVPEPNSLALVSLALVGIGFSVYRRQV